MNNEPDYKDNLYFERTNKMRTPQVGDVWINKTTGDRVQVKLSLTTIIYDWHEVGETIYPYDFDRDMFLRAFTYLGKSKANINDLFKTENEDE